MNSKMTELAREAVACYGWRWMEGMAVYPDGYREGDKSIRLGCEAFAPHGFWIGMYSGSKTAIDPDIENSIPDLTDPATLGCLLHLVREVCTPAEFREAVGWCFGNHVRGKRSMMDDRGIVVKYLVDALKAGGDQ